MEVGVLVVGLDVGVIEVGLEVGFRVRFAVGLEEGLIVVGAAIVGFDDRPTFGLAEGLMVVGAALVGFDDRLATGFEVGVRVVGDGLAAPLEGLEEAGLRERDGSAVGAEDAAVKRL